MSRGAVNAEIMNLKKSIANPFAIGINPRIPDGKHILSNAMKSQAVKEIAFGAQEGFVAQPVDPETFVSPWPEYIAKDVLDILFFPGLNNMICLGTNVPVNPQLWHGASVGGILAPTGPNSFVEGVNPPGEHRQFRFYPPIPLDTHTGLTTEDTIPLDDSEPDGVVTNKFGTLLQRVHGLSNGIKWNDQNTQIQKWRLVTAGLRISCINNAVNNAGWFECQRLNIPADGTHLWALIPQPFGRNAGYHSTNGNTNLNNPVNQAPYVGGYYRNMRYIISGRPYMDDAQIPIANGTVGNGLPLPLVSKTPMHDNPTYMSGKLRDIHKQLFRLKPSNDEHDYKELQQTRIGRADMNNNFPWNLDNTTAPAYTKVNTTQQGEFVDDTFDCIHIRIHGSDGTRVLLHYVANQELVYQDSALVTRLASRSSALADERAIAAAYNRIPALAATQPTPTATTRRTTTTRVLTPGNTPKRKKSRRRLF